MRSKLHLVLLGNARPRPSVRRDRRGRRIGANWWRDYNLSALHSAENAWQALRESALPAYQAAGASHSGVACHQLSEAEFRELHPRPTLKDFLIRNAGMNADADAA